MRKVLILVLSAFVIFTAGCATTANKQKEEEIQGLKEQVSGLESQVETKDGEINTLKYYLMKLAQEKKDLEARFSLSQPQEESKSEPEPKQIQIALKNAGYNPGPIDGKLGRQTVEAIKAFQKSNNLAADGKVGKQTWGLLAGYWEEKNK